MIEFRCPHCRGPLKLDDRLAGMEMACPSCQVALVVPRLGLEAGRMLGGYQVRQYLGGGGFGEVYQVHQVSMDRSLALKALPADRSADPRWSAALERAARAMARARHPAIVHAVDAGEADGIRYLASWLVQGDDLAWRIERQGRLPVHEVLRIGVQAAGALGRVWENVQTAHGNLKPTNLMTNAAGEVLLLDFGLVRPLHAEAIAAMHPLTDCTASYVSPEQVAGQTDPDFRTDLYSLGATLYFAATGVAPYFGASPRDIVERLIQQPLPPAQKLNPSISPAFSALLGQMMATSCAARPSGWREVLVELERLHKEAQAAQPAAAPAPAKPVPSPAKPSPAVRPPVRARAGSLRRPAQTAAAPSAPAKSRPLPIILGTLAILGVIGVADIYLLRHLDARKKAAQAAADQAATDAARVQRANLVRRELQTVRNLLADPAPDLYTLRQRIQWIEKQADEGGVMAQFAAEITAVENALHARASATMSEPADARPPPSDPPAYEPPTLSAYARERETILNGIASALLAGQAAQANALLAAARQRHADAEAAADLDPLGRALAGVTSPAVPLAASFRAQVGQIVSVGFKGGPERLRIQEAGAEVCRSVRVVVQDGRVVASSPRSFRYEELSVDEALSRLAGSGEASALAAGLFAARAGDRERAAARLRQVPAPLGPLLAGQLDRMGLP